MNRKHLIFNGVKKTHNKNVNSASFSKGFDSKIFRKGRVGLSTTLSNVVNKNNQKGLKNGFTSFTSDTKPMRSSNIIPNKYSGNNRIFNSNNSSRTNLNVSKTS